MSLVRRSSHILPALLLLLPGLFATCQTTPKAASELAWSIRYDPKTLDPAKVDEQASEMIRFLTGGVLLRLNRQTQQPEPELVSSWSASPDGRVLIFHLRDGLRFSDGSDLRSRDVAWSLRRVLAAATAAPVAEEFLLPLEVKIETPDALTVKVLLPKRVIGIGKVFDEIAIEPVDRPSEGRVTAGPYFVADYKRGQSLRLERNPAYWRHDAVGIQLPYVRAIRLDVLASREQEIAHFQHGEYDWIEGLPPDYFAVLGHKDPKAVLDLGPSLNTEQIWFNQAAGAALPAYEKAWFQNRAFRVAVSEAIHRADLARIAYSGHATAAYGFISPASTLWYNQKLQFPHEDIAAAARLLATTGFHSKSGHLYDAGEHPVKFSILTNAGNAARQKMATLIQQDLAALGIEVTVVSLDFPALIERLMHTQDYEACLLGLVNVDPDPNSMMNLWLSSSMNHQWNPSEKTPATPWEAEIDSLMKAQATSLNDQDRKRSFDQVQQIVADQQPFIYLVYPNTLDAVSPRLTGVHPSIYQPGLAWNINNISRQGAH